MVYLMIIAVLIVFYISYFLIRDNDKINNLYALILPFIFSIVFVILYSRLAGAAIAMILLVLGIVIIILNAVLLIKNKKIIGTISALVPLFIGIVIIIWLFYINIINDSCEGVEGCMNETGMYSLYAMFFLVISFIITAVSHINFMLHHQGSK